MKNALRFIRDLLLTASLYIGIALLLGFMTGHAVKGFVESPSTERGIRETKAAAEHVWEVLTGD